MRNPKKKIHNWLIKASILSWPLFVFACGIQEGRPSPTPLPAVTPTKTAAAPTRVPSPTPQPQLLLVSAQPEGEVESELIGWGAENGYQVIQLDPGSELQAALADENLRIVVSVASGLGQELASYAGRWKYLAVDEQGIEATERVSVIGGETRFEQVGFLAGITAGFVHQTGAVGIVSRGDGAGADSLLTGFNQGVKYTCPRCTVVSQPLDTWESGEFSREGVEVVFAPLGPGELETLQALSDLGYWLILSGPEADSFQDEQIAARISFKTSHLVGQALDKLKLGEVDHVWPYSVETGGLGLVDLNPARISPGREQRLKEILRTLEEGALQVNADR